MNEAVSIRLSRMRYVVIALAIGPLLGFVAMMLVSDGPGLVRLDSWWIVVFGLGVQAAFVAWTGRVARRSQTETLIAVAGSVAASCILAVTLIVIWLLTLPPNFFN